MSIHTGERAQFANVPQGVREAVAEQDPRWLIDHRAMSGFQWAIVALMIGLNALDGFDVLSISFASPGIAQEWGIDRGALGLVLSMELVGMAVGSVLLGRIADRIGRRATILACLPGMAAGMFGAATAASVSALSLWRVLTGLGIGGMLAATNAAVAEASNLAKRNLAVVLMAAGYPVGTVIGGSIATALLAHSDWRAVFVFGGVVTLVFVPLAALWAPESIAFLLHRRPPGALGRVNAVLRRLGHPQIGALPGTRVEPSRTPFSRLFSADLRGLTGLLTLAYLAHVMTFYFILKWIPKIVADMGYPASAAGGVLVWASLGGLAGSVSLGLLALRVPVRRLTIIAMIASVLLVAWFGQGARDLSGLAWLAALAGFATNAGVVGLYALLAASFPTGLRASATGFVIGVGRGGSALAPALAGVLLGSGYGLPAVAVLMGLGSAVAAVALLLLRR
jgi:benzoate transport